MEVELETNVEAEVKIEAEVDLEAKVDLEAEVEIDAEVDVEIDAAFGQADAPVPTVQAEEAIVMKMNEAYDDILTDEHAAFTVNPLHTQDGEILPGIDGAMGSGMFMEGAPSSPAHMQARAAGKDGIQWDYAIGFVTPQIEVASQQIEVRVSSACLQDDATEEERQEKTEIFENSQKNLNVLMAALQRANLSHSAPRPTPSGASSSSLH